jgi:hypothetical protein
MQQCWLKLVYHCLEPGAALENMFAWVIVAYSQNLWAHLGFLGVFLGRNCLLLTSIDEHHPFSPPKVTVINLIFCNVMVDNSKVHIQLKKY